MILPSIKSIYKLMRRLCMKLICNGRPAPAYGNGCVFLWRVGSCRGCDHSLSLSLPPCCTLERSGRYCRYSVWAAASLSSVVCPSSPAPEPHHVLSPPSASLLLPPWALVSFIYLTQLQLSWVLIHERYPGWMSAVIIMVVSDLTTSFISCIAGLALTDQLGLNEK